MKTLMRNGRDRRAENPSLGHARKERVSLFGTDQRITSGPAARRPHSKAEYMTAPERFADSQILLAPRAPSIHDPKRSSGHVPISLSHRPRDGSVVSSLHCMNDPLAEGHMASRIGRRKFLATLGGAAVAWPLAARAQQPTPIVGLINSRSAQDALRNVAAFRKGLDETGYVE